MGQTRSPLLYLDKPIEQEKLDQLWQAQEEAHDRYGFKLVGRSGLICMRFSW